MAAQELDRLGDASLAPDERERRKRRLTKGPREFRDLRGDLPSRRAERTVRPVTAEPAATAKGV